MPTSRRCVPKAIKWAKGLVGCLGDNMSARGKGVDEWVMMLERKVGQWCKAGEMGGPRM